MIVSANVLYVFISENIKIVALYFFVNLFALSFTQDIHYFPFDIIIQFLSVQAVFTVVYHGCAFHFTENISTSIALYVAVTCFVSTKPSLHIFSRNI
jgi:hypothetical protein